MSSRLEIREAEPDNGSASRVGLDPEAQRPERADELEMLGRFEGSGHREAPSLVRRADGQVVQLTPLLYEVLRAMDGQRGYDDIATEVGRNVGRAATAEDIRFLAENKLRPLGVLRLPDGSQPVAKKANPLLALRFRAVITDRRVTSAIAGIFSKLFVPPVVFAFMGAFIASTGWLLVDKGLALATRQAIYQPHLLLLVFFLTALSAGFHEIGHAAACRYGGGRPGAMGVGLYLVWPAFYTDVTDSYRLSRRDRLRVDLGGIYFNAIFAVAAFGAWAATGWAALLVVIPLQLFQMLRQLIPLVRLDGYHILADLTGVPDLFAHVKPILQSMNPFRRGRDSNTLRPKVRLIVSTWVLLVVPVLAFILVMLAITLPRIAATAWDSLGLRWESFYASAAERAFADAGLSLLQIVALLLPVLSITYLLARVVRRTSSNVWRATAGRPGRRALAVVAAAALLAGLATAWWPGERYTPIGPHERGTLADIIRTIPAPSTAGAVDPTPLKELESFVPSGGQRAPSTDVLAAEPAAGSIGGLPPGGSSDPVAHDTVEPEPGFPGALPDAPGEGDNQALAVNTQDGATVADLAFDLLTVAEGVADQANEAYAFASCTDCSTVAIAVQVIMLIGQVDLVAPQNVAAAINAFCDTCLTYALALQLIVSLDEPLSPAAMERLEAIGADLEKLGNKIGELSIEELQAELDAIEAAILDVLVAEGAEVVDLIDVDDAEESEIEGDETGIEEDDASVVPSPSPSPSNEPSPSPSPSDEPSPDPSPSPSPEPSPSPNSEPSPSP